MRTKEIVLVIIILGLFLNLLANMVWNYLPDRKVYPYTYVVATIVIIVVCILHIIFGREDSGKGFLTKLWKKLGSRETIEFVPNTTHGYEAYWRNGKSHGKPAMSIHSEWYGTNLTDGSVRILRAYLVKPKVEADMICTQRPYSDEFSNEFPILPGDTSRLCVDFWIQPPIRKEGETFKGKIVFIDQFNNKHRIKVTFCYYTMV